MHDVIFVQDSDGCEYFPEDGLELLLRLEQPHLQKLQQIDMQLLHDDVD